MKNLKRNVKGITLIALVISIIVLLILAGISIAMLIGENGILTRAQTAKNKTEEAQKDENEKLQELEDVINGIDTIILKQGEKATKTQKNNYIDTFGNKATIPAGFAVSQKEGENTIDDGLVIIDSDGNEFVWIPVGKIKDSKGETKTIELKRYVFNDAGEIDDKNTQINPSDKMDFGRETYYFEAKKDEITVNAHAKDIEKFIISVKRFGGYYIGRYEARKSNDEKLTEIKTDPVDYKITQKYASEKAIGMYADRIDYESDLMNQYAYTTAIFFIQEFGGVAENEVKYSLQTSKNTSFENFGTYQKDKENRDCKCNIYDMASNCREWSTTTYTKNGWECVVMGGDWAHPEIKCGSGNYVTLDFTGPEYSFRPILYLK